MTCTCPWFDGGQFSETCSIVPHAKMAREKREAVEKVLHQRDDESLFYIECITHSGNCRLWWRPNGEGYTTNLDDAWKVPNDKAEAIHRNRPLVDFAVSVEEMNAKAERHVRR